MCTPASSTTKTGRHDIAEILLKVALKHQKSINQLFYYINVMTIRMFYGKFADEGDNSVDNPNIYNVEPRGRQ